MNIFPEPPCLPIRKNEKGSGKATCEYLISATLRTRGSSNNAETNSTPVRHFSETSPQVPSSYSYLPYGPYFDLLISLPFLNQR